MRGRSGRGAAGGVRGLCAKFDALGQRHRHQSQRRRHHADGGGPAHEGAQLVIDGAQNISVAAVGHASGRDRPAAASPFAVTSGWRAKRCAAASCDRRSQRAHTSCWTTPLRKAKPDATSTPRYRKMDKRRSQASKWATRGLPTDGLERPLRGEGRTHGVRLRAAARWWSTLRTSASRRPVR